MARKNSSALRESDTPPAGGTRDAVERAIEMSKRRIPGKWKLAEIKAGKRSRWAPKVTTEVPEDAAPDAADARESANC